MSRAVRRRRRYHVGTPPNIGWEALYVADTFGLNNGDVIAKAWEPVYGTTALGVIGVPTYGTGSALFDGKPHVLWTATTDGFGADIGTASQGFVIVSFEYLTGAPAASGLMYDSYDDGIALPANRCWWQYQNTVIDQTRISGGTALAANWTNIGLAAEHLVESTYNGASSAQKSDGAADHITGDAGANSMQGLALTGYNGASAVETRRCAYVGRISVANWTAGRDEHIDWHNTRYSAALS